MIPAQRFTACTLLALAACTTQAPPPLDAAHPAHPSAPRGEAPAAGAPAPLSRYRDFSPPARTAPVPAGTPSTGDTHHDHQPR